LPGATAQLQAIDTLLLETRIAGQGKPERGFASALKKLTSKVGHAAARSREGPARNSNREASIRKSDDWRTNHDQTWPRLPARRALLSQGSVRARRRGGFRPLKKDDALVRLNDINKAIDEELVRLGKEKPRLPRLGGTRPGSS